MSVDDLEFLVKIVAVGFTDRDFCCSEVEFVAFDLADAVEVDDVGTVGSGEVCGQEWDELGEGHEGHDGFVVLEDEGGVVALGLDVEKAG